MSTLNVSNITDGTDTVETGYVVNGSAKAWVNFNGTGTASIRDSFNMASLTDNGTGVYVVTFSSAMATGNYAVAPSTSNDSSVRADGVGVVPFQTTRFRIVTNAATADANNITAATNGDLA